MYVVANLFIFIFDVHLKVVVRLFYVFSEIYLDTITNFEVVYNFIA